MSDEIGKASAEARGKALLLACLTAGAVFLLRVRRSRRGRPVLQHRDGAAQDGGDSKLRAARMIEADRVLRPRYEARFGESGIPLRYALDGRIRLLIGAAERTRHLREIASLVQARQADAIRTALAEWNRPALAKWARAKARARRAGRSVHEFPSSRRRRGRPSGDRELLKRLRDLGLEPVEAEDVLCLAGLRVPSRLPARQ